MNSVPSSSSSSNVVDNEENVSSNFQPRSSFLRWYICGAKIWPTSSALMLDIGCALMLDVGCSFSSKNLPITIFFLKIWISKVMERERREYCWLKIKRSTNLRDKIMASTTEDEWLLNKWKSGPAEIKETASDLSGTSFDCNICLDVVQEPVVTLCGHLYCWPCIYKWINLHRTSGDYSGQQQHQAYCPLCKTKLSTATVVPLYGLGQTAKPSKGKALELGQVPRRPSAPCREILSPPIRSNHQSPSRDNLNAGGSDYTSSRSLLNLGVSTTASTFNPVIGMLSEMVYTKMFGNSASRVYNHPNSYNLGDSSSSPRMRRREMQADKSLSRICFFVFCCMMVCLILF